MSIGGQPPDTAGKVPVLDTVVESYRFVFTNPGRFLALGWLPLLITFAVNMVSDVRGEVGGGEDASLADWMADIALEAAYWAMYAVFAVRWHRFFLLDERESVFSEFLAARNWRFLVYTLLLTFAPFVPVWVLLLISGFVSILPSIAASILLFVMFRFSLVLPGTAVDRPLGLGEAWRKMLGHTWRFIGAFFLVAIPAMFLIWIVSAILGQSLSGGITSGEPESMADVSVVTNAAIAIIGFLWTAAGITVLSKFYRHIVGMDAPEGSAAGISS
ncbi:MAG: hypothetical protein IH904_08460 [Proteobacteria bacterium]|nr:hypothetical protein [Pseudomonadota bacterium]